MKRTITTLVFMLCIASAISAAEFSDLFVFGDSLSDVGNLSSATLRIQPGPRYFDGRFSNGAVYSELFADLLELGPLRKSEDGGNNFAYAGGRTSGTTIFEGGFLLNDLDEQIDEFLRERTLDPDALHVVLAGANDFVLGDQTNATIPARRVEEQLTRLVDAGAINLFSINLPLLGDTPQFADRKADMNQLTTEFNQELAEGLDRIEDANPIVKITRLDMETLFGHIVSLPAAFGFTNVVNQGINASDVTGFVFWDDVHPTTAAHSLLADAAFALFADDPIVGDFNFDGQLESWDVDLLGHAIQTETYDPAYDLIMDSVLDTQDIDQWLSMAGTTNADANLDGEVGFNDFLTLSRSFGNADNILWSDGDFDANGEVGFPDFLLLARHFGNPAAAQPPADLTTVPEPKGGLVLWIVAALLSTRNRWRRGNELARWSDKYVPTWS